MYISESHLLLHRAHERRRQRDGLRHRYVRDLEVQRRRDRRDRLTARWRGLISAFRSRAVPARDVCCAT